MSLLQSFGMKYSVRQNSIRVSEDNYNDCFILLNNLSKNMGIPVPECYIMDVEEKNAVTFGLKRPYVVIYRRLFEISSKEELKAILAHELAHIKNKDYFLRMIDNLLMDSSSFLGIPKLIGEIFLFLRRTDYRIAEIKADIEALKQTNIETMKKICLLFLGETDSSKINFDKIVEDLYKKEKQNYFELFLTHPTPIHRYMILKEADKLIKSGEKEIFIGSKKKHLFKIISWTILLFILWGLFITAVISPFDLIFGDIITGILAFIGTFFWFWNLKQYRSFKKKNKISLS